MIIESYKRETIGVEVNGCSMFTSPVSHCYYIGTHVFNFNWSPIVIWLGSYSNLQIQFVNGSFLLLCVINGICLLVVCISLETKTIVSYHQSHFSLHTVFASCFFSSDFLLFPNLSPVLKMEHSDLDNSFGFVQDVKNIHIAV